MLEFLIKLLVNPVGNRYTNPWTDSEIVILQENYNKMTDKELGTLLGKTPASVENKRIRLRLLKSSDYIHRKNVKNLGENLNPWTKEELEFLKENYSKLEREQILKVLRNRSWGAIMMKAHRLGLKKNPGNRLSPLLEPEKAYIAGIIDGEGTIGLYGGISESGYWYLHPSLHISNTKLELVQYVKTLTDLGHITPYTPSNPRHNICYHFFITNYQEIKQFLKAVESYLTIKKEQANLLLEFLHLRGEHSKGYSERELEIYSKLKELNARGQSSKRI